MSDMSQMSDVSQMSDMLQLVVKMRNIESGTALVAGVTRRQAKAYRTFA
jgi:hypothetical protein